MLKTIDDACDFVATWCQDKCPYPGQAINLDFALPDCIVRLNARVGDLWHTAKPQPGPILQYATPLLGLLGGQDQILNPSKYARDEYGIVPFVWENQGVWGYGFDPTALDQFVVCGDWCDGVQRADDAKWRRVAARPEDALVCTLLINLCMQSDANWDDRAPKPEAAHTVLWQHPAWRDFDGFWVNDEQTLIYFSGWQVMRR